MFISNPMNEVQLIEQQEVDQITIATNSFPKPK